MAAPQSLARPLPQTGASESEDKIPTSVKILFPIALAVLAAALNVAAVRKQIAPVSAYVYKHDLKAGTQIAAEDLQPIEIAGRLGSLAFVRPNELLVKNSETATAMSFEASLAKSPRVLSKDVIHGELVCKSSFGGQETVQAGANEGKYFVPVSTIRGAERLRAGQKFHLLARKRTASSDGEQPQVIGPFRVAVEDSAPANKKDNEDRKNIAVIYPLTKEGKLSKDAELLYAATTSDERYNLTVIEKSGKRSSPPTTAQVTQRSKPN